MSDVPSTMTAIVVPTPGGPEALTKVERPVPRPGHGEVLIKVAAAGLNGADLSQRRGRYEMPPGASDILGLDEAQQCRDVLADVVVARALPEFLRPPVVIFQREAGDLFQVLRIHVFSPSASLPAQAGNPVHPRPGNGRDFAQPRLAGKT